MEGEWSERQDLNLRRLAPKASALARLSYAPTEGRSIFTLVNDCATEFDAQSSPESWRKRPFESQPRSFRRCCAVELLRDKMLGLLETEVALRHRVLDDEDRPVRSILAADDQVISQSYGLG